MRELDRIGRLLTLIAELWAYDPDARLLQLLLNGVDYQGAELELLDPYLIEDDVLERGLRARVEQLRRDGREKFRSL